MHIEDVNNNYICIRAPKSANGRVSRLVRSQGGSKGSGVSRLVRSEESFQGRCSFKTGSDATEVPRTSYVMSWSRVAPGAPVLVVQG